MTDTGSRSASASTTTVATIVCPVCGTATRQSMPSDRCVFFYECPACGTVLRPRPGDCCVFCSYADVSCPSVQAAGRRPRVTGS